MLCSKVCWTVKRLVFSLPERAGFTRQNVLFVWVTFSRANVCASCPVATFSIRLRWTTGSRPKRRFAPRANRMLRFLSRRLYRRNRASVRPCRQEIRHQGGVNPGTALCPPLSRGRRRSRCPAHPANVRRFLIPTYPSRLLSPTSGTGCPTYLATLPVPPRLDEIRRKARTNERTDGRGASD